MYDIRDRDADFKREWRHVKDTVTSQKQAELGQFDQVLFLAIWKTVASWGLSAAHARELYEAIKAVK